MSPIQVAFRRSLVLACVWSLFATLSTDANPSHASAIQENTQGEAPVGGHWPQWHGPQRDNLSKETGLLTSWPEGGPPLEWRVGGIGEGIASVSVAKGRIYTVGYIDGYEYLLALDQRTGRKIWVARLGSAVAESPLMRWLSQRSPTVDAGRIYVMRADGDLICLQTTDGVELWRKSYPKDFGAGRPNWGFCDYPLVDGDRLICSPGSPDAGIAALNKFNGDVIWRTPIPGIDRGIYGAVVAANIGDVRQFVTFSKQGIFGVAAKDGHRLWHYNRLPIRYNALHTPRVVGDELFVASGYGGTLALLKLIPGESGFRVQEQYRLDKMRVDPFQDNVIVVDDYVYTFPLRLGPTCLSLETGETVWGGDRRRRRRTSVTYADGHLIARQSDGVVRLIEAKPERYSEKGQFTIPDHEPSIGATAPVLAGGRLYLRDNNRLFCYDVRADALVPRPKPQSIELRLTDEEAKPLPKGRGGLRSVYVPTPHDVVQKMLELAKIKTTDLLYDLGSGDGRIVIAAAKEYGCHAVGYEIDPELVALSRANAEKVGVGRLAHFECRDLFTVRLHKADVITVYLLPEQLERLIPQLKWLKNGARIVSHYVEIPGAKPDEVMNVESTEDGETHKVLLWTAPLFQDD